MNIIYRKTKLADIELLVKLRLDFIKDEGIEMTSDETDSFIITCRNYFEKAIENKSFIAIVAENNGKAISTAFMTLSERPPRKPFIPCLSGTIYNVFTHEKYRRQGVATNILKLIIEEARNNGAEFIDLLATQDGKSVYEKLGFWSIDMTSMRKELGCEK